MVGPQAGGLADQEDARHGRVGLGVAGDRDRLGLGEIACAVAEAAGAEPGVEGHQLGTLPGFGSESWRKVAWRWLRR